MAIDRGPWNALVDDDGSNLVGTVWNKDKIKTTILDPVDVAIAPPWVAIPHSGVTFTASTGTWTVAAGSYNLAYTVLGTTAFFSMVLNATTISSSTTRLFLTLPGGVPIAAIGVETAVPYLVASTAGVGLTEISGGNPKIGFLRDLLGTAWPAVAGSGFLRAQWFYRIA